jgi:hypothetical protein
VEGVVGGGGLGGGAAPWINDIETHIDLFLCQPGKGILPLLVILYGAGPLPHSVKNPEERLHFVEEFAGEQNMSNGLRLFDFIGISCDKRYMSLHDFLTPAGFMFLLGAVWRLTPGGLLFLAPPCSNFILTSFGSTGRRNGQGDEWKGNQKHQSVRTNNMLVSRLCQILWIASKRGIKWIIEQPNSSVMFNHTRLKKLMKKLGATVAEFDMGTFGSPTPKPTVFVGTAEFIGTYPRKLTPAQKQAMKEANPSIHVAKKIKKADGSPGYAGGPDMKAQLAEWIQDAH